MDTIPGYTYVVTAAEDVTVTDSHGLVLEVPAGEQRTFVASTTEVNYSAPCTIIQVRGNFSMPPAAGGGGQITVDPAPTQGSENAVSSGGVYTALQGKQNSLTAGDGIALTGGTIAVDASGAVAADDTLPVSGETVAAALQGYLPTAEGVAPEVKGNVTFSGSVLVASNNFKTKYDGKNIFFGGDHNYSPIGSAQGIYFRRVDSYGPGSVCFQLGNSYVNNFYIGMTNSAVEGMGTSRMSWRHQQYENIMPNNKCFVLAVDRALSFGETSTDTALRGKTLELRVCDQTDTTGASDTVLTLDAAKLQKLIDFIDTL